MLLKCCTQYVSKFGKLNSSHRTGKGQYSFQSQRRATPRNVQTTIQLHSFHMLARSCSKSFKLSFSSTVNQELPDVQGGFRKGRWTRHQIAYICRIIGKAREFQENIYFCYIDYAKTFHCGSQQTGKFLKRWEYQTTWPASWETCVQIEKQELESYKE